MQFRHGACILAAVVHGGAPSTNPIGNPEVSDVHPERREAVRGAVLRYLDEHPLASDTVTGICEWWLRGEGVDEAPELVEVVLERLVAEGHLRVVELPEGTRVYGSLVSREPGT